MKKYKAIFNSVTYEGDDVIRGSDDYLYIEADTLEEAITKAHAEINEYYDLFEYEVIEMKEYRVHFMGYYGYDVDIEAESEDEAKEKAENIFDEADANEFWFESNGVDVFEAD